MPRFETIWRNKWLTAECKSLDEMVAHLRDAADYLEEMHSDGVQLDPDGDTANDYAFLYTYDPVVAKKYEMDEPDEEEDDASICQECRAEICAECGVPLDEPDDTDTDNDDEEPLAP